VCEIMYKIIYSRKCVYHRIRNAVNQENDR